MSLMKGFMLISILFSLISHSHGNYELWFNTSTYQQNFPFYIVLPIYRGMTNLGIPNDARPDRNALNSNTTKYPWAPYMLLLSFPNSYVNGTFVKDKQTWILTFSHNMIDNTSHSGWANANIDVIFTYQYPNILYIRNPWFVSIGNKYFVDHQPNSGPDYFTTKMEEYPYNEVKYSN